MYLFFLFSSMFFFIFIFFMFFSPQVNSKHILFSFSPQSFSHHCYSGKNFFPYSFICFIFLLYASEDTVQAKCRGGVYVFVFCLHFVCKCIILILFVILLLLLHTVLHTPSLSFYNLSAFWAIYIECEISEHRSQFFVNTWFLILKLGR